MRFRGPFVALACLAAACCTKPVPAPTSTPPVARPAPTPTPTPAPVTASWMDAAQTPGDWYYRAGGGTTRALFGDAGADARFAVTCNPAQRTITLARAGAVASPAPIRIATEFGERSIAAAPSANAIPSVEANVSATDAILDQMAFSKGRFAVFVAGLDSLYLPSWPEVTRVIEDCR